MVGVNIDKSWWIQEFGVFLAISHGKRNVKPGHDRIYRTPQNLRKSIYLHKDIATPTWAPNWKNTMSTSCLHNNSVFKSAYFRRTNTMSYSARGYRGYFHFTEVKYRAYRASDWKTHDKRRKSRYVRKLSADTIAPMNKQAEFHTSFRTPRRSDNTIVLSIQYVFLTLASWPDCIPRSTHRDVSNSPLASRNRPYHDDPPETHPAFIPTWWTQHRRSLPKRKDQRQAAERNASIAFPDSCTHTCTRTRAYLNVCVCIRIYMCVYTREWVYGIQYMYVLYLQ